MRILGIIAEYNPFHKGHAWQIAETRRQLGADCAVVCVMSGNWVQRGECASADKHTRTALALGGGADLVLELPTPWAISSAESFARGGVGVLAATGVVDTLCFGSESGDLDGLRTTADCLNSAAFGGGLRRFLNQGMSFAAARQSVCRGLLGAAAECLSTPNNNLAVEYLRVLPSGMTAFTVPRLGADHDGGPAGGVASASAIRALLLGGAAADAAPFLTRPWEGDLSAMAHCERAVLARLRSMEQGAFAALPDSGEGLSFRLMAAAKAGRSLTEVYELAKTKRYAHARIRRLVLWAYLGLTLADRPVGLPYLRVLGFGPGGRAILREMEGRATLPIITKPAHAKALAEPGRRLFELEARCTDLYGLCFPEIREGGGEWTTGPVLL